MKLNNKQSKNMRWTARIMALLILLFALPFYFGYGNPLPFASPEYTAGENFGLTIFPLILIGLALGWKYEKLGGYLTLISIVVGLVVSLFAGDDFLPITILVGLIPGILYLMLAYNKKDKKIEE